MDRFRVKLKYLRESKGWSVRELSRQSGVSKTQIGEIERGTGSPNYRTLQRLAECFGMTVEELFEDDEHAATNDTGTEG